MKDGIINIHGREYHTVAKRVQDFRETCPAFGILNECISSTDDTCLYRCTITDETGRTLAVGHAFETKAASKINRTSMHENCESSAVGRALAFLGFGVDGSIASADEVQQAIAVQDSTEALTVDVGAAKRAVLDAVLRKRDDLDKGEAGLVAKAYWEDYGLTEPITREALDELLSVIKGG